jgi:spermidine synthase
MKNKNSESIALKLVMLIYFFSGVCALMDEVVWVRLLKLTIGNTVYASSIVVSVFMGGLALGALIMSKYTDKIVKRLRLYAILELFATISALLFPLFLKLMDRVYQNIFIQFDPSSKALLFFQIIVSAILLLFPAMAMGSTLPLIGRYITSLRDKVGNLVGKLYALNTLGAALGCFLSGFVLIRVVGVIGTIYVAAAINLLVVIGGWILSRTFDNSNTEQDVPINILPDENKKVSQLSSVLLAAIFLSGFISIGYELIWMRSIVFLLGGPTYVFSAVLTIYLLGNVLGAWIGSRLSKSLSNHALAFGISLTILGILGIFYINWLDIWQTKLMSAFISATRNIWENAYIRSLFFPVFNCLFLFLIPAIIMGIGFPIALQAWGNYRDKVGKTTGTVYGANTIGAVLGGLLTGFLFIPHYGVQSSIILLGLTGIWFGSILIFIFWSNVKVIIRTSLLLLAVFFTIAAMSIPSDFFKRHFVKISGSSTKVLAIHEGLNTTVSVHENDLGERTLATSNVQVAGNHQGFRITQKILGHMGILLNANTKRILTVGFGSGESSNCMSKHTLDRVDVVEIAPELVKMSLKYFNNINLGDSIDKKNVHIIYMDAKNYLHLTNNQYDVVVADAISPRQVAENASLYTKEYFQNVKDHLRPGGILGCWLPIQEIPISCINSVLGTFKETFPYVTIWLSITAPSDYDFLYLVGSKEPQVYSPYHMEKEFNNGNVKKSLEYINFFNSHDVLSCYITDQDGLKNYLKDYKVNSDYTPFIEFSPDINEQVSFKRQWLKGFINQVRKNDIYKKIDWTGISPEEQIKWKIDNQIYTKVANLLIDARTETNPLIILQKCYYGLKLMPENIGLKQQQEFALKDIFSMAGKPANVKPLISTVDMILKREPTFGTAWLLRSWVYSEIAKPEEAYISAENAVKYCPYLAMAQYNMGSILLKMQQYEKSIPYLKEACRLDPVNTIYQKKLAKASMVPAILKNK